MKIICFLTTFLFISIQGLNAQFYHSDVLPDLQGQDLSDALLVEYKPRFTLGESNMKDTLMARIFWEADGMVRCVYTQHEKPLDPESPDPNQDVFDEGRQTGLNVEHIFPKNKGAGTGQAISDMHHLAPTKVNVNSDRGNLPFDELNDNDTDRWYRKTVEQNNKPNSNIDEYSEWTNQGFEPREDFKGNVARSVFYFYTMYKNFADAEDPSFFSSQRAMLCDWHYLDPVDSLEWERTFKIAKYQDDRVNPFVLDCSVAARTYCADISESCERTVPTIEFDNQLIAVGNAFPNPSLHGNVSLPIYSTHPKDFDVEVMNSAGQSIEKRVYLNLTGKNTIEFQLKSGYYIFRIISNEGQQIETQSVFIH